MRKLTLLTTLIFTVMFSSTSFAGWTKVTEVDGDTYYVDFERIRKHGGYVYWWELWDKLKPDEREILSYQSYKQGDCKLFRYKFLTITGHKGPMGRGTSESFNISTSNYWRDAHPNSVFEITQKHACKYAK